VTTTCWRPRGSWSRRTWWTTCTARRTRLGLRLLLAQSAIDPLHATAVHEKEWHRAVTSHPAPHSMFSAMRYFTGLATDIQAHRFRHEIANLYLGYGAEAAYLLAQYTPPVWEYLTLRQFNNFRPCLVIGDVVGGYEVPEALYARRDVQRAVTLACNASTAVNDLYSTRREAASRRPHHNLTTVIAAEAKCPLDEAFARGVAVHNQLMYAFEEAAARLAVEDPILARFMESLAAWLSGSHEWHAGMVGIRYAVSP
jgi:2-methylisoborneol synthase